MRDAIVVVERAQLKTSEIIQNVIKSVEEEYPDFFGKKPIPITAEENAREQYPWVIIKESENRSEIHIGNKVILACLNNILPYFNEPVFPSRFDSMTPTDEERYVRLREVYSGVYAAILQDVINQHNILHANVNNSKSAAIASDIGSDKGDEKSQAGGR
jgi:hypothetical protein